MLKKYRSVLQIALSGLAGGISASCLASGTDMDVTFKANVVENTCQISLPDKGKVHLPMVGKSWFENSDGSTRLQPTDFAAGTTFTVRVENCSGDSGAVNHLNFSFQPQIKQWFSTTRQVFMNETSVEDGGAANTGIVIFSNTLHTNVLNADGTSKVVVEAKDNWATEYEFSARLQNTGPVTAGKVTSHVLVDTTYE